LRATKDMLAGTAGAPPPETEEEPGAEQQPVAEEEPVTEAQAPVEPSPPEKPDDGSRDKVRRQLIRLHESGKRRADVARYLARFESSDYEDMLDEIFGPEPPPAPEPEIKPLRPEPVAAEEQPVAPEPATDEAPGEPAPAEEPDAAAPPGVSPSAAPGDDRGREMVRRQLSRLRESGKRRDEVEDYLVRFKRSDYKDLIDEVFEPQQPSEHPERLPSS